MQQPQRGPERHGRWSGHDDGVTGGRESRLAVTGFASSRCSARRRAIAVNADYDEPSFRGTCERIRVRVPGDEAVIRPVQHDPCVGRVGGVDEPDPRDAGGSWTLRFPRRRTRSSVRQATTAAVPPPTRVREGRGLFVRRSYPRSIAKPTNRQNFRRGRPGCVPADTRRMVGEKRPAIRPAIATAPRRR